MIIIEVHMSMSIIVRKLVVQFMTCVETQLPGSIAVEQHKFEN